MCDINYLYKPTILYDILLYIRKYVNLYIYISHT